MKILVTAGPTREYWDQVRFLSNSSSGRMGYAIARAARSLGHRVSLVSGPTDLKPPSGLKFIPVTSAAEMERAVGREFPSCNLVIMAAAVCDFRPAAPLRGKLKKEKLAGLSLKLVKNTDILRSLGHRKGNRKLIGFALEVQNATANAKKKLRDKNLDFIVLNGPGALEGDKASVTVFGRDGSKRVWKDRSKAEIARRLIQIASSTT